MSGSLNVGSKQVLILLVGAIGGETAAGGFRVASQLGQALVSLAQTVSKAIYPELVHAQDNAHDMARRMANIALIAGVLAVLVTLFFGRTALALTAAVDFDNAARLADPDSEKEFTISFFGINCIRLEANWKGPNPDYREDHHLRCYVCGNFTPAHGFCTCHE